MKRRARHHGQASVEYTIATVILIVALFVPWNGERAPVVLFLEAVRDFYANASFVLSLP